MTDYRARVGFTLDSGPDGTERWAEAVLEVLLDVPSLIDADACANLARGTGEWVFSLVSQTPILGVAEEVLAHVRKALGEVASQPGPWPELLGLSVQVDLEREGE